MCIRDRAYRDGEEPDPYLFDGSMSMEDYALMPVSYTHLDVYKRQLPLHACSLPTRNGKRKNCNPTSKNRKKQPTNWTQQRQLSRKMCIRDRGMVCSKQLFKEDLNHPFDEPKKCEIREVNDIMNHCETGRNYFSNPRVFPEYGRKKGWERETKATDISNGAEKIPEGFEEVTEQMELPF